MLLHTDRYNTFQQDLVDVELPGHRLGSHPVGYVSPSGKVFQCAPYNHLNMLENFFVNNPGYYAELYAEYEEYCIKNSINIDSNLSIYDEFALVELGWVKIAAYGAPGSSGPMETWDYNFHLIRTQELTPEQIDVIYPR